MLLLWHLLVNVVDCVAGFDMHDKCARCRDKGLGSDACIVGGVICKYVMDLLISNEKCWLHQSTRYARAKLNAQFS